MIDPVAIIKDIAEAAGYKFIYGGSAYANYELTSLGDLTDDYIVVFMFPFIENAEVVSSGIDGFTLDTIISVGRKTESATMSSLDETEKQKYDRRLKDLKAYLVNFVQSILCNSDFELNSLRIDSTLNRFNENLDTVNGQLTLRYSNSATGTGYDITAPLPEQVDWSRISNKPEPITALSGTNTGDQDLSGYAEKITNYSHSIHANESLFPETGSANLIYKSLDSGFLYRWNGSTYYAVGITTPIGTEYYKALAGNSVLNKLFDVDIPNPVDGDIPMRNGTRGKYKALNLINDNIGIGTNKPDEKLHVLGAIKSIEERYGNYGKFAGYGSSGRPRSTFFIGGDASIINAGFWVVPDSDVSKPTFIEVMDSKDLNSTTKSRLMLYVDSGASILLSSKGSGALAGSKVGISNLGSLDIANAGIVLDTTQNVGIGISSPSAKLDINGNKLRLRTSKTPSSATDTGNTGDICWDSNYIYVCVATNTWKRTALSTW